MVTKKTNKISPKDINFLLNKLIIIIRNFSIRCGNKKLIKRGGVGRWDMVKYLPFYGDQEKKLKDDISNFLTSEFSQSRSYFNRFKLSELRQLPLNTKTNLDIFDPSNIKGTSGVGYYHHSTMDPDYTEFAKYFENKLANEKEYFKYGDEKDKNRVWLFFKDYSDKSKINMFSVSINRLPKDAATELLKKFKKYYMLFSKIFYNKQIILTKDDFEILKNIYTIDSYIKTNDTGYKLYIYIKKIYEDVKKINDNVDHDTDKFIDIKPYHDFNGYFDNDYLNIYIKNAAIYNIGLIIKSIDEMDI